MEIDYYAVLDVKRDASIWEIKMAYRKLALRLHPLRKQYQQHPHPRPEGVFDLPLPALPENSYWELLNEAYDVLSNDLWREIYNVHGEMGLKRGVAVPNGFIPPYKYHNDYMRTYFEFFGSYSPYCDIIDAVTNPPSLYQVKEGRGVIHKDPQITKLLRLTLIDVFRGCTKFHTYKRKMFVDESKSEIEDREVTLTIPIRAGCLEGTKITFPEHGDETITRKPADIVFITCDEPHKIFRRDKWDLHMNYSITLKQALTGFKMSILTLDDRKLKFHITDIVDANYVKTLKCEGLRYFDNQNLRGDLIIHFDIKFPSYIPKMLRLKVDELFDEIQEYEEREGQMSTKMLCARDCVVNNDSTN